MTCSIILAQTRWDRVEGKKFRYHIHVLFHVSKWMRMEPWQPKTFSFLGGGGGGGTRNWHASRGKVAIRERREDKWARLVKERAENGKRQRHSFFSYRVIQKWNLLPTGLKMAPSLDSFKNRWDDSQEELKNLKWSELFETTILTIDLSWNDHVPCEMTKTNVDYWTLWHWINRLIAYS